MVEAGDRERALDILADRPRSLLTILWADGHQSAYEFEYLRRNCPCAECAGEAGRPGRLAQNPEFSESETTLQGVEAVGLFGIRPSWADGHATGIYGLSLLRALCPCPECRQT